MPRSLSRLLLTSALAIAGCDKGDTASTPPAETTPPPTAEAEVVPNLQAQPGDTTTCPYSGRPFLVKAEHPKVEWEGNGYWICSEEAAEKVRADPAKYFESFEG